MDRESFPSPAPSPEEESKEEALNRVYRHHVRRDAKNLRDWIRRFPDVPNRDEMVSRLEFRNRDSILSKIEEILSLMPPASPEEEEYEEDMRQLENRRGSPPAEPSAD